MKRKVALYALFTCLALACMPTHASANLYRHYYYNQPAYYYNIRSVGYGGKTIEISDESVWTINPYDTRRVSRWQRGDQIIVSPGAYEGDFCITNVSRKQYATATLTLGSKKSNPNTSRIVAIDPYNRFVETETSDGRILRWNVTSADQDLLFKWAVGNFVILGSNDGWWSHYTGSRSMILINSNHYPDYVQATPY